MQIIKEIWPRTALIIGRDRRVIKSLLGQVIVRI